MVLVMCDMRSLVTLAAVCKRFRRAVLLEFQQSFRHYLSRFVRNPIELIDGMRINGTVLSGSAALGWIDRTAVWSPRNLDFYCPYDLFLPLNFRRTHCSHHANHRLYPAHLQPVQEPERISLQEGDMRAHHHDFNDLQNRRLPKPYRLCSVPHPSLPFDTRHELH